MIQDKIFELSEADNWFLRNRETLIGKDAEKDLIFTLIKKLKDNNKIEKVLELGCSNGYRLNFLKTTYKNINRAVGMDASQKAVEDGIKRYNLELYKDTIIDFKYNEQFDMVIVNFVYHWLDRATVLKAIANTDSLVKEGGYLIVGDFLPDFPQKRFYHHLPEEKIYTYKLDYSKVFESLNTYKTIHKTTFDADSGYDFTIKPVESSSRGCCCILKKHLYDYYKEV